MKNAKTVAKATKNDNANLSIEDRWAKNANKRATWLQAKGVVSHLNRVEDKPDGINYGNGYMIVDRLGLSVLRDPFSNNPYITFHATRRVGGGVVDFDAIKFLKFSA